ncbi:DMT family transporter [Bosea minatitlanensis]|uniref:DMT family transporter n=1 Tax=Bosea minatitlanensis TaxID=128782 RepID=A0ABW0F5X2_9HYPH|nr:DMT family transporter [Bosea minatitlanensis]MCT4496075.1 DMT family transporter [Bosea minatitlanensis]
MPSPIPSGPASETAHPAPAGSLRRDNALLGIGIMLLATIFLSAGDAASKYLASENVPALHIVWLRYTTSGLILLAIVAWPGTRISLRTRRAGLQLLRGIGLIGSSVLFVSSLKYLKIADATATSFVAPLFVTALSIPFLGEKVGWRRWLATVIGLMGVLIVVRPGGSGFQPASLLPVFSSLSWAFSLIVTRLMSGTENPVATITWSTLFGALVSTLLLPLHWVEPSWTIAWVGLFIGAVSTAGHWLVIVAFRFAAASLLAPFSYIQLFWASLFGFLLFATLPDLWTWAGAAIIAGSGLYTAHRERARAREVTGRAG